MVAKRAFFGLWAILALPSCSPNVEGPPPRATDAIVVEQKASLLTVPITGDISTLGASLEREIPKEMWSVHRPDMECVPSKEVKVAFVKLKTPTIKCDIIGRVTRGPLRFSGKGREIELTMPITAVVHARDIGGILKQETATARAMAHARITLTVAPDWTLRGAIDLTYRWIDSPHLDFLGRRIDLSEPAARELGPIIAKLEKQLPAELAKLELRKEIEKAWNHAFVSIELNHRNPPVWMRVTPQELQYGGYDLEGRTLKLRLGLKAITETFVGQRPPAPSPAPLPPMRPLEGTTGNVEFFIPVIANYEELEPVLMKALIKRSRRPFVINEDAEVIAHFQKVIIYGTTGGRLAVGLNFSVQGVEERLGPASGTVWLTAKPINEHNSRRVSFTGLRVSGTTDMTGGDLILRVANSPALSETIAEALRQNFERDYQELLEKIDRAIADKRAGKVEIRAKLTEHETGVIQAAGQGLYLPVHAKGRASISVIK